MVTASLSSLLGEDEDNPNYTENVKLVKKYQLTINVKNITICNQKNK